MTDKNKAIEEIEDSIRFAELALESLNNGLESIKRQYAEVQKDIEGYTFTQVEAAGVVGCSRRTIIRKLKSGELKSLKINDVLKFKRG